MKTGIKWVLDYGTILLSTAALIFSAYTTVRIGQVTVERNEWRNVANEAASVAREGVDLAKWWKNEATTCWSDEHELPQK
jgi:hypothetical protein